jgi:hypothetical protein
MAKSLDELVASSMKSDRVTIETLVTVVDRCNAEVAAQIDAQNRALADSVDFNLNASERADAAQLAAQAEREAKTYAQAAEALSAKLEAKRSSDAQMAAKAERERALARRNDLVERWRAVPSIFAELTQLFADTIANADHMRAMGMTERDAESEARGVTLLGRGGEPDAFVKMRIPLWDRAGRQWPPEPGRAHLQIDYAAARDAARNSDKRAEEMEEASFGKYRIVNSTGCPVVFESRRSRGCIVDLDPWEGEVAHGVIDKLRAKYGTGLKAIPLENAEAA